ncbi:DUF3352 domain-containing protein [Nocardioides euryhalodurans]|uniref:DUF3352 domain-containing protein n=1 Tax=Nocardioides euryhalodurans TaxID=2518370 RepID=UPI0014202902|nr:DUF3352 domain-containing protein [Nocardioides euryhalodurans]
MSTTTPPPEGPGGPEYLEQGGGEPAPRSSSGGGGRRTALVAGGAVAVLALAGAGTWAAMSFLGSGAQPAEALPAGTLGYASIDLDPSGSQKIEAVRTLNKFPAIKEELGLAADDDLRRKIFEEALTDCDSVSYADDVEPWLGNAFAVAAVDTGEEQPSPVFVAEISDAAAAEEGLTAVREGCGSEEGGWSIEGDWAVAAETDEIAQQVTDAAAEGTLADDSDYQDWMAEVGDEGVITMYAAPEAGPLMADLMASDLAGMAQGGMPGGMGPQGAVPEELTAQLEEFPGAAATVRFADGAAELEFVGGVAATGVLESDAEGVDTVTSLPADTAAAFGMALPDGWGQKLLDQMSSMSGGQMDPEQLVAQAEQMTGLSLPEDLEALLGDSTAIALGGDFSAEALANSSDGSDVPVGIKVDGDAAEVQRVLDQLTTTFGPGFEQVLGSDADDDTVAVGPNADYRSDLLADGGLGDSEAFQRVVPEADSSSVVLFVNFDAGDWLSGLTAGDDQAAANTEPLDSLGFSVWQDDEVSHGLLKLTTD